MVTDAVLLMHLREIVGQRHVLTGERRTAAHSKGYRTGGGKVLAVVQPGRLVEQWRVVGACVEAGVILIMQAANTGLTGGSTPDGDYDRPVVIVSTRRLTGIHVIAGGKQVVCLPGATLNALEQTLRPFAREPHSVIGSSCIGASVVGGVCNNSGGALVRRGPAYTEMALFARVDAFGKLELVNHLGIALGVEPEAILERLERGGFTAAEICEGHGRAASDRTYERHVRDIDASSPARFNADATRLFEASGSAGKVIVFAVRLDTFPKDHDTRVFYVGSNDPSEFTALRRAILGTFTNLPVAAEYMHRDCFEVAARYGKDTFLAIAKLGTGRIPTLFAAKSWLSALPLIPPNLVDRVMQWLADRMPQHLPSRLREYGQRYEHHLLLRMSNGGIKEAQAWLDAAFPSASGDFFECSDTEADAAFLHRFAAAGAAIRYRALYKGSVEDIVALDIALPRNCTDWTERLPPRLAGSALKALYYGHFLCHVFHQDYIVAKGANCAEFEHDLLAILDAKGAEYPAEHNVGHLYAAKPALADHYQALDPCNVFNPGIGGTRRDVRLPSAEQ